MQSKKESQHYPDYLTTNDVSKLLRVSTHWVQQQIRTGKIPAIRIGFRFFVPTVFYQDTLQNNPEFVPSTMVLYENQEGATCE
jgi:excisionase family DNA binding protein